LAGGEKASIRSDYFAPLASRVVADWPVRFPAASAYLSVPCPPMVVSSQFAWIFQSALVPPPSSLIVFRRIR
jgi:hypothetical protein